MTTNQLTGWPQTPPTAPPLFDPGDPRLAVPPPVPVTMYPTNDPTGPPTGPPTRPPGGRRRGALIAVVAVTLALVLLAGAGAGLVVVRSRGGDPAGTATGPTTPTTPSTQAPNPRTTPTTVPDPGGSATTPTSPTAPTSPATPTSLDEAIAEIERFVEQDRGLTFAHDVEITVLTDAEFEQQVRDQVEGSKDAMEEQGDLLKAAGLIPASFDMVQGQLDLLSAGVLGFYDPTTKALVVRGGTEVTPFLREILAHELTHALDDQHVSLDRPDLEHVTDGRDFAFLALVEGSAKRVENDYVAQFDAQEQQQLQQEMLTMGFEQMQTLTDIPMVLPRLQMAPYDYGEPFAKALVAHGGTAALDAAMRDLPTTSEQILDLTRYDAREGALAVDRPPADGEVSQEGTLGQLMTGFLLHGRASGGLDGLGGLGAGGDIDAETLQQLLDLLLGAGGGLGGLGDLGASGFPPIETVAGWGGDHYVVYRTGTQRCLRVDWRMDTAVALTQLDTELHEWAATDPAVQLARPTTDTVRATRCGAA